MTTHGPWLHSPPGPLDHRGHQSGAVRHDPVAVSVRNQAIDRLLRMNRRHAAHAWQHRRAQPVGPHAIAFLYADPIPCDDGGPQFFTVVAATRMVDDGQGVRDLPELLFRLTALARDRYAPTPGGFDPAVQMTHHHDRASGHAHYIGLGISTLDTPDQSWQRAQRVATDEVDVPGRCLAVLADHTALLVDRAGRQGRYEVTVHSTGDLNHAGGLATRLWTQHPDVSTMPTPVGVWERIHELHHLTLTQPRRPTL